MISAIVAVFVGIKEYPRVQLSGRSECCNQDCSFTSYDRDVDGIGRRHGFNSGRILVDIAVGIRLTKTDSLD